MAHLASSVLKEKLSEAELLIPVGTRYAHYKHPEMPYRILTHAFLEANEEIAVVYLQEDTGLTFIRPLTSFTETIEVDGVPTPRFSKC